MEAARLEREQVQANARWLFNQEVQLITFYKPGRCKWCAVIMPEGSSLRSISTAGGNNDVLECVWGTDTFQELYRMLLDKLSNLIGEIYWGGGNYGTFVVDESKLPRRIHGPADAAARAAAPPNNVENNQKLQSTIENMEQKTQKLQSTIENMGQETQNLQRAVEDIAARQTKMISRPDSEDNAAHMNELTTVLRKLQHTLEIFPQSESAHEDQCTHPRCRDQYHNLSERSSIRQRPPCSCQTHPQNPQYRRSTPQHPHCNDRPVVIPTVPDPQQHANPPYFTMTPDTSESSDTEGRLTPRAEDYASENEAPTTTGDRMGTTRMEAVVSVGEVQEAIDRVLAKALGKHPNISEKQYTWRFGRD